MAQKIIERVEARYEAREVPFGKVYEWHPAYVALECDCGEKLTPYRYQHHNRLFVRRRPRRLRPRPPRARRPSTGQAHPPLVLRCQRAGTATPSRMRPLIPKARPGVTTMFRQITR